MLSARDDQLAGARPRSRLRDGLVNLAIHDWIVLAYAVVLNVAVALAPSGPVKDHCLLRVGTLLTLLVTMLILVRGRFVKDGFFTAFSYRVILYGTVQISYFFFRELLPLINPRSLDNDLHRLGVLLFGAEPALALDAVVNHSSTEWFAFFYFGYFFVLATHVLPILFVSRDERTMSEFCFGMVFMFCIGHILYMLVPGYGPYRAVAGEFHNALPEGLWLDVVMETVAEGGAQKDIFPSLHTAAPTFIALYSFRHRALPPFRYTWPIVAFFAVNIIVATMFLRWHWIVDVVAGLTLATAAQVVSALATTHELERRKRLALEPAWPKFPTFRKPAPQQSPSPETP
jgi:hypothetical protein